MILIPGYQAGPSGLDRLVCFLSPKLTFQTIQLLLQQPGLLAHIFGRLSAGPKPISQTFVRWRFSRIIYIFAHL